MTLDGKLRYAAAIIRGFSEGAAVAGCALVPSSIYTIIASIVILFDAAVVYEGAEFVSKRVVYSPTSKAYLGTVIISFIWVVWRPIKGRYPVDAMWFMTAFGFAWNAFAITSGARVVSPASGSLLFAGYDALFEIALLYASLSQMALYVYEGVFGYDLHVFPYKRVTTVIKEVLYGRAEKVPTMATSSSSGCLCIPGTTKFDYAYTKNKKSNTNTNTNTNTNKINNINKSTGKGNSPAGRPPLAPVALNTMGSVASSANSSNSSNSSSGGNVSTSSSLDSLNHETAWPNGARSRADSKDSVNDENGRVSIRSLSEEENGIDYTAYTERRSRAGSLLGNNVPVGQILRSEKTAGW
jgi:hypothetical protein